MALWNKQELHVWWGIKSEFLGLQYMEENRDLKAIVIFLNKFIMNKSLKTIK